LPIGADVACRLQVCTGDLAVIHEFACLLSVAQCDADPIRAAED
jgi:hypothetical protein